MTPSPFLSRRACLQALGGAALLQAVPAARAGVAVDRLARKRLIVLMLSGGNDGLNTVVPVRDPLYWQLRPTVALSPRDCLSLNGDLALHPALRTLRGLYERGELAVVQDVGYPQPSLSHFFSADVWYSGETAAEHLREGWWGNAVLDNRAAFDAAGLDAEALLFSSGNAVARGRGVGQFQASRLPRGAGAMHGSAPRPALSGDAPSLVRQLAEGLELQHRIAQRLGQRLIGRPLPVIEDRGEELMQQVQLLLAVLDRNVSVPLFTLEHSGYDVHTGQRERQAALFKALDAGLATLTDGLRAAGLWDDTVVFVYSEFGRRAAQNGHGGTDHGAAGPAFLLGGRVEGGLYGSQPRLDRLDENGNLRHGTDLRRLYASLLGDLWQLPVNRPMAAGHAPLGLRLA